MSFYQEYLKKQKEKERQEKKPQKLTPNIEDAVTDEVPPTIPLQMNSSASGDKFSDLQKREEKERLDFIKRVKGENVPPLIPETPAEDSNIQMSIPPKPARIEKVLVRIIVILVLVAIIFAFTILWRQLSKTVRDRGAEVIIEKEIEEVIVPEVADPRALFTFDKFEYPSITRPNELSSHLLQYYKEEEGEDTLTRIIFKDQINPKEPSLVTVGSFLNAISITMPSSFAVRVDQESLNSFIHYREDSNEVGFATIITEADGFTGMMREWEDNAIRDTSLFLSFLNKETNSSSQFFTPSTYKQNIIRCLDYEDGSELCYAIIKTPIENIFAFTTSSDTIKRLIDSI